MNNKIVQAFIGLFTTLATRVKTFIPEIVPRLEPIYHSSELFDDLIGDADKMTQLAIHLKVVERDPMEVIKLGLAIATYGMCGYLIEREQAGREGLIDQLNRRLEELMLDAVAVAVKPAKGVN